MTYTVLITRAAERDLDRLSADIHFRITQRILRLEDAPRPVGTRKLQAQDQYRLRVGEYRVLYQIYDNSQTVTIVGVAHRREAYR